MNRSGYSDDLEDTWALVCWRGAVKKAITGKRGQEFLKELLCALDSLEKKELIHGELTDGVNVCAVGAVMQKRNIDMQGINVNDYETIAKAVGVAPALVRELEYENDTAVCDYIYRQMLESAAVIGTRDEIRFSRVRAWVVSQIKDCA